MLKKILKWVVAMVLFVVGLVFLVGALQDLSGTSSGPEPEGRAAQPIWNTSDVNTLANGNLQIAAAAIKSLSPGNGVRHNDPAAVLKTPWKYYGQLLCYVGMAEVVEDYPAGSGFSKSLQSNEAGEVVLAHDDGTILDFFVVGGTGALKAGQTAFLCGLPIGRVEVPNKLGGTFTHLVLVGFAD